MNICPLPPYPALGIIVFAAPLLLAALGGCTGDSATQQTVILGGERFHLELALADAQRVQGLSDRPQIAPDGGMLFVFPAPVRHSFVMRRCLVPIDILFVDSSGYIVALHEMQVEPYERTDQELKPYGSDWPYQFAIELRAGSIQRLHLRQGLMIGLGDAQLEDLKKRAR